MSDAATSRLAVIHLHCAQLGQLGPDLAAARDRAAERAAVLRAAVLDHGMLTGMALKGRPEVSMMSWRASTGTPTIFDLFEIGSINAPDAKDIPRCPLKNPTTPAGYMSFGTYRLRYIRSMNSTSRVTWLSSTSPTL